jgi:L-alanine-DL-glutamate epimerase-like enolase superfamily enzyme
VSATTLTGVRVESLRATACTIGVDAPGGSESDGTLEWDATTIVLVEAHAGEVAGHGYTYGDPVVADLIERKLAPAVRGSDAMAVERAWQAMAREVRNLGRPGIAAHAISAVDVALWDLKARLLGLPLFELLGAVREQVAIYGSGGFCSYSDAELAGQLGGWAGQGIDRVKMKIGRDPAADEHRVAVARQAIGPDVELMVDANGAWTVPQALAAVSAWRERHEITWVEEPVSSDDLRGLREIRDRAPAGVAVAAGEYGYTPDYHARMLDAGAVDVLQADATRCGGITGMLNVGAQCVARQVPLSAHTCPAIHAHVGCALAPLIHVEYFHDHARIERLLFDGAPQPHDGALAPDPSRPGLGIEPRAEEVARWAS